MTKIVIAIEIENVLEEDIDRKYKFERSVYYQADLKDILEHSEYLYFGINNSAAFDRYKSFSSEATATKALEKAGWIERYGGENLLIFSVEEVKQQIADTYRAYKQDSPQHNKLRSQLENYPGDGTKWGASDFYEDLEQLIKKAIKNHTDFDCGYSCKKEIVSTRICKVGYTYTIEVSQSIDELPYLANVAFWEAAGGNSFASSGYEALAKLFGESKAEDLMGEFVDSQMGDPDGCYTETTWEHTETIRNTINPNPHRLSDKQTELTYSRLVEIIDEGADTCDKELKENYKFLVRAAKGYIAYWQEQNAT